MTLTIAQDPPIAPDAVVSPTEPDWVPLGPGMTGRFVVLTRGLADPIGGGYWAGPDRPDGYSDCLASAHLRTGSGTFYAPVAAFRDAGIAWRIWNRYHGPNLGHGWVREICRLSDIADWTRIPPIRPRHAHR